jgi:hypothetical protein
MFDDFEPIPTGLDRMPPGPALAAFLASIDVDRVSGFDRVIVLRAEQRMASHHTAQMYAAMAAVADHMEEADVVDDELVWDAAATEIRAALRLTRRGAEAELDTALAIRQRLPLVWEAMRAGDIDWRRARVLAHGTEAVDTDTARAVIERIIDDAPRLTTGELAAQLRRLCMEVEPDAASLRYREAVEQRRVVLEASSDGTAHLLGLDLAPHQATAAANHIDRIAHSLNHRDDPRSIDQIRADIFIDLLTGTSTAPGTGTVEIRVDLDTLATLADTPGDLSGYGPVIADIARQVTNANTDGQWRFTITDPVTGLPIHDGTTRRRPTAAQRRSVTARDTTCIFPGCRTPASRCDLDHRTPWSREPITSTHGLDPACRYDHITVRHNLGWVHQPLPGGDHLWTSPLGHQYTKSGRPP